MEYSIKEVAKAIDISEQGLYKRIKTNYAEYIKCGIIAIKKVEQPNGTKEQIFLTETGIKELLKTKQLRNGATLKGFTDNTKEVEQPLNQVEQPTTKPTKPKEDTKSKNSMSDKVYEVLNQQIEQLNRQIEDLKADKKELNEKLDKQEANFNERLDKQEALFKDTLNHLSMSFQNALLQLQEPKQDISQEAVQDTQIVNADTTEKKGFFKRLFRK